MNEKYLEQKLTLYRNLITIFWTSSFILGGGLYSIAFKLNHWILVFIFGTGLVFEIAVFSIAIILIIRCKELVKKLKEFK